MALPQEKFRELVFQLLYSRDQGDAADKAMAKMMMKELSVTKKTVLQAQERVAAIVEVQDELDTKIGGASESYEFDRIQLVERNVLRLGVYELIYDDAVPAAVVISEAIRLCRKFGTREAAKFVNAVLDHLHKGGQEDVVAESVEELVDSEQRHEEAAQEEE